jgi:hypothetical protein
VSILNIWPSPSRTVVACDTAFATSQGGVELLQVGQVPKMLPLVHLGGVMAGRGNLLFLFEAWRFAAVGLYKSFDHLLGDLEALYVRAAEGTAAAAAVVGAAEPAPSELAVVGYSHRKARVVSVVLVPDGPATGVERFELRDPWITPSDDAGLVSGPLVDEVPFTAQEAAGIMRHQVELYRGPSGVALGAPFVVATVTRDRVAIDLIP